MLNELQAANTRAASIREQLNKANNDYYLLDQPTLADADYDKLLRELTDLETLFPEIVTDDSPTQRVGTAPSAGFQPHTHRAQMFSLGNAFNEAEIRAFDGRVRKQLGLVDGDVVEYCAELKIDGLAMSLTYERGKLTTCATRGDGNVGRGYHIEYSHREIDPVDVTDRST